MTANVVVKSSMVGGKIKMWWWAPRPELSVPSERAALWMKIFALLLELTPIIYLPASRAMELGCISQEH